MVEWEPISINGLRARIEQGCARMTPAQLRLWEAIRIEPEKWEQHPYGDQGNGFWAVGLVGLEVSGASRWLQGMRCEVQSSGQSGDGPGPRSTRPALEGGELPVPRGERHRDEDGEDADLSEGVRRARPRRRASGDHRPNEPRFGDHRESEAEHR